MSKDADSVVSVNVQGKECSQPVVLHLMPCEINASGVNKAKVDCYFTSTMKKDGANGKACNTDAIIIRCHVVTGMDEKTILVI